MYKEHKSITTFFKDDSKECYSGKRRFFFCKKIRTRGLRGVLDKRNGCRVLGIYSDEGNVFVIPFMPTEKLIKVISHEFMHKVITEAGFDTDLNHHWATERVDLFGKRVN